MVGIAKPLPPPHTAQSGRAQRALQSPSHKKPKALTFVSKDDGTPPLFCFASSAIVCLADQSAFICTTGCALTEQSLKSYLAPLSPSPFPHPPTAQSGLAQRALQRPRNKKPKALTL